MHTVDPVEAASLFPEPIAGAERAQKDDPRRNAKGHEEGTMATFSELFGIWRWNVGQRRWGGHAAARRDRGRSMWLAVIQRGALVIDVDALRCGGMRRWAVGRQGRG